MRRKTDASDFLQRVLWVTSDKQSSTEHTTTEVDEAETDRNSEESRPFDIKELGEITAETSDSFSTLLHHSEVSIRKLFTNGAERTIAEQELLVRTFTVS